MDLEIEFCGLLSPNPFWLASGPPTGSAEMIIRGFEAGWGGAVYKTLALEAQPDQPNVNASPCIVSFSYGNKKLAGLENIELNTDRPLRQNLQDIYEIKKHFPKNPLFVSIMALPYKKDWIDLAKMVEDAGADGLELNFSCPHSSIRGRRAGASIGQNPELSQEITGWVRQVTRLPIIVKLPPETSDIRSIGRAVKSGGANAISAINTYPCILGVDLETLNPIPTVWGYSTSGGYSGPPIKPIALKKVADLASDSEINLPISGIGGITNWRDALEFILLGASTVQVCTWVMHYGYRIIQDFIDGVGQWMKEHNFGKITDFRGASLSRLRTQEELDRSRFLRAEIDLSDCIKCGLCYVACRDGGHQAIFLNEERIPSVDLKACKGCGLCMAICPVDCIQMTPVLYSDQLEEES